MPDRRKIKGSVLGLIGYLLSPLSWWNDLFVNVPLALAFAWIISLFHPAIFKISFVVGYWLTNVLGFVLLHKAAQELLSAQGIKLYSWKQLTRDVLISLAYTLLIVALVKSGLIEPLPDYFPESKPPTTPSRTHSAGAMSKTAQWARSSPPGPSRKTALP